MTYTAEKQTMRQPRRQLHIANRPVLAVLHGTELMALLGNSVNLWVHLFSPMRNRCFLFYFMTLKFYSIQQLIKTQDGRSLWVAPLRFMSANMSSESGRQCPQRLFRGEFILRMKEALPNLEKKKNRNSPATMKTFSI